MKLVEQECNCGAKINVVLYPHEHTWECGVCSTQYTMTPINKSDDFTKWVWTKRAPQMTRIG